MTGRSVGGMATRALEYIRFRFARRGRRADLVAFTALIAVVVLVPFALRNRLFGGAIPPAPDGAITSPAARDRTPEPLSGPKPNFVFILTDDQRFDDMDVLTNVKRLLADRGTTFANAFASTPLCCPSRASILTGSYSRTTEVYDNKKPNGGVEAFRDTSSVAAALQNHGYETGYVGKYLNGYEQIRDAANTFVPKGWSDWHGLVSGRGNEYYDYALNENGRLTNFGRDPSDYMTDVFADRAVSFINDATSPFFLHFSPYAPHLPGTPAPQDFTAFRSEGPRRPASFDVVASGDSPAATFGPMSDFTKRFVDVYRRNARASLLAVDRAVGAIVDAVEQRDQLDNTVFIFMSDNGHLFGEHRIFGKVWPYEPSIRVPLIVRGPRVQAGRIENRLVQNIDIAPTLIELAGLGKMRVSGRSLVPLLRGQETPWRQELLFEYLGDKETRDYPPRYRAIRTDHLKLVVYEDGSRELFDLLSDPDEMENLAGTQAGAEYEDVLADRLDELFPPLIFDEPQRESSSSDVPSPAPTNTP